MPHDDPIDTPGDRPDDEAPAFRSQHFTLNVLRSAVAKPDDAEVGVTLLVSGAWVSGLLIGARQYYEDLTVGLHEAPAGAEAFTAGWTEAIAPIIKDLREHPVTHTRTLFLRNATIWRPGADPAVGLLLSIAVDKVDAFAFGSMRA